MNAPADPACAPRCRESFARQKAMGLIGARLAVVEPGYTRAEVYADDGAHVATMLQTLMMLADTPDTP
ncbi:MAG TPA: hypothetical protein VH600_00385 [Burkholderiales bacterium]